MGKDAVGIVVEIDDYWDSKGAAGLDEVDKVALKRCL